MTEKRIAIFIDEIRNRVDDRAREVVNEEVVLLGALPILFARRSREHPTRFSIFVAYLAHGPASPPPTTSKKRTLRRNTDAGPHTS